MNRGNCMLLRWHEMVKKKKKRHCACAVTTRVRALQLLRDVLSAAGFLCDKAALFRDTIKWTSCTFQCVIKHHPSIRRHINCLTDHVVTWATKLPTIYKQWLYCGLRSTGFSVHWHTVYGLCFHFNVIIHGLYHQAVLCYHRHDHEHAVPNGQHGSK